MKALIVGASGFIGRRLVKHLAEQGVEVEGYSRTLPNKAWLASSGAQMWHLGELRDIEALSRALRDVDVCYHLASSSIPQTANKDPIADVELNLCGSLTLFEAAAQAKVGRLIFISSGGTVYGVPMYIPVDETHPLNPIGSYGIVKLAIEKYCEFYWKKSSLDYRIARLSNVYGPGQRLDRKQGIIPLFIDKVMRGEQIEIWGDGSAVRDYVYIDDVVDAITRLASDESDFKEFNISSGSGFSVRNVIEIIERCCKQTAAVKFGPSSVHDVPANVLSRERAVRLLDLSPATPLQDGIMETVMWMAEHRGA